MHGLRDRLRMSHTQVGAWVTSSDPAVMEIMAGAGFDLLVVDTEHAPIGPETLERLVLAASGSESSIVVRVAINEPARIGHALDAGADGILVPQVSTAAEVAAAVAACRYPPAGTRGFGPRRAGGYGRRVEDYARDANAAVAVLVQVERAEAVANIDSICAVPGLDAVFIGPNDLAGSLGWPRQLDHPAVQGAIDHVCQRAATGEMPVGIAVGAPSDVSGCVARGIRLVMVASDVSLLARASDEAARASRQVAGAGG